MSPQEKPMNSPERKMKARPYFSLLALISFIVSFSVARIFTTFKPDIVLISSGIHIHHFWYGLAMLVIGGWLGISYTSERIDRIAAILFGAGGGLVGDEVGLLLTFENYWTEITYTFMIILLTFISMLFLLNRYSKVIRTEIHEFASVNRCLYVGILLFAISIAFLLEIENVFITIILSGILIVSCALIFTFILHRFLRH